MKKSTEPAYRLIGKTYQIRLDDEGHLGDEVMLTGDDDRFRIHTYGSGEQMSISYKTLPQFAAYFRKLADRIESLHEDIERHPGKIEMLHEISD